MTNVCGEDEATFKRILKNFVEPATSEVSEIGQAFAAHSAARVGAVAHKLHSSARAVGANQLANLCGALETAGKADDWGDIERFAPQLEMELKRVTEFIRRL